MTLVEIVNIEIILTKLEEEVVGATMEAEGHAKLGLEAGVVTRLLRM